MGTAAGAKKAREVRALKRCMRAEREDRPGRSIGARLSVAQRTLLKGCYGQPLTDEELEVWQEATRRDYPAIEFLEGGGRDVIITSPEALGRAMEGLAGTRIVAHRNGARREHLGQGTNA